MTSPLYLGPSDSDLVHIPEELVACPQWVCWRGIQEATRLNKPPYMAHEPYGPARVNDPRTWDSFDVAINALPHLLESWVCSPNYAGGGIGFVFSPHDPYCGIDLDKCATPDGVPEAWAMHLLTRFNSYTEISPTRTGAKIWLQGKLPGPGRKTKHIELYDRTRYFTVNGAHLYSTPATIEPRHDSLSTLS